MERETKTFGIVKSIIFSCIISLVFVLLTEITLRYIIDYQSKSSGLFLKFHVPEIKSEGYDYDPSVFWRLKKNFKGQVSRNHPLMVSINSMGTRGPEFSEEKIAGTVRIIVIGDSTAFGWAVPEEKTFSRRLEALLNKKAGRHRFQVVNAGVPGYTSYQGLHYLKEYLLKFNPDAVIVYFGLNDFTGARFYSDKEQGPDGEAARRGVFGFLRSMKIYQLLYDFIVKIPLKGKSDNLFFSRQNFRVSPDNYCLNLKEMKQLAREKGFKIYFITPVWNSPDNILFNYPFWFKDKVDILGNTSPVINTYSALKQSQTGSKKLFMDPAHPTELGHEIISETIFKVISKDFIR